MTALEKIKRRQEIEARIVALNRGITATNVQPLALAASDARERYESALARHGHTPKSERAQADLVDLKQRMEQISGTLNKAKAEETTLRDELNALQEELKNQSITFSMDELTAASKRIAALKEEEQTISDALTEKEGVVARQDEGATTHAELMKEREDLLAQQATGADVKAPMDKLLKKMGDFQAKDSNRTEAALVAAPVLAGLRRRLEAVQTDLAQAEEDTKGLTQLFILAEIGKENQVYSSLKDQIAASFTRIISLAELIPPKQASAIMPASGVYRLYIPVFSLPQGDDISGEDFNPRCIDRPAAVAAEREKLINQGARI
jgi:DNA repair exonuclease SbcCD ATPase subunit